MSPDLAYFLMLGFRMAVAAAFVVSASFIAERSGPAIGALVATLPISAGPSYVFLALDHDSAFVAQGALTSLPINAATIFLGLTYTLLAQRRSLLVSVGAARHRGDHRLIAMVGVGRSFHQCGRLCDLHPADAALSPCKNAAGRAALV
jgi:hypothetical protein